MSKRIVVGGIAVIFAICIIIFGLLAYFLISNRPLNFIQNTTNIHLPSGISHVDTFDNLETYVVAHVKLPNGQVDAFRDRYGFTEAFDGEAATDWADMLSPDNRTPPSEGELHYLSGRSNTNRWLYTLDINSGRLWIVVFYADPGGALP